MKQRYGFCILILFSSCIAYAQRPVFLTESARTIGPQLLQTGLGIEYLEKHQAPGRDFPQTELRSFMAGMLFGVSDNVDFTLEWRGSLMATYPGGGRGYDWGDLTVTTKINVINQGDKFPSVGLRTAVKLPNTSYLPYRLGSDQTDFFVYVLLSGLIGNIETRVNLGFGIIGTPTAAGIQNDIFILSAAGILPLSTHAKVFGEVGGFKGYFGGDGKLVARAGAMLEWEDVEWNVFCSVRALGDNRDFGTAFELSENWSVGVYWKKNIWW